MTGADNPDRPYKPSPIIRKWELEKLHKKNLLSMMLVKQKKFQNKYKMHPALKDVGVALASEALEIWKAGGGKWWSKKTYTHEQKVEEIADGMHFLLLSMIEEKVSAEELYEVYCKKLQENYARQESKVY